jgi:hypothetical protein
MSSQTKTGVLPTAAHSFPAYGWVGLVLVWVFWILNWALSGARTHWAFFPMWLGYCLAIDGLARRRTGTSLITRSWRKYIGLFLVSAPAWWIFEGFNAVTHNWIYQGIAQFTPLQYGFWTTLCFTTVMPAMFGTAELIAGLGLLPERVPGPIIQPDRQTTVGFFAAGWLMLILLFTWPRIFFPFVWIAMYFILEPLNVWLGFGSLVAWTRKGDWRPVVALWSGVLLTAFFWEMWNYLSYPKWIYEVPWGNWLHVFEMPLLGYGGYLPFSLELFALYHLVQGILGDPHSDFVKLAVS